MILNDQEGHSDSFRINVESFRTFRDLLFHQQITGRAPVLKAWYILLALGDLKNPFVCLKFMQGMINEQAHFCYTYLPALIFQLCMTNERNTSTPCSFHHLVALILKGRDGGKLWNWVGPRVILIFKILDFPKIMGFLGK